MKMIKKTLALSLGLITVSGVASFAQSLADAKKAIDAEQYQKATSMLKTLVANQPKQGDNYFNLGNVYLISEEVDSAKATYTRGVTADPKNANNYIGLGHADLISGNAAAAKGNFDKAVELGKKNYQTYMNIGKAYLAQTNPDYTAALPLLQKADELDAKDKDPETFLALADFYAMQRKNTEAYPQYLRALDIDPTLHRANVQIGKMFKDAQGFPEAENQVKRVIEEDPNYGPAYRELAEIQMQWSHSTPTGAQEKREQALQNMKKYLDLTDVSFDSRLRYAQFLVYANDFATLEKEVATLNAPDANNPKTFVVIRMRGYSAIENGNYDQGVKYMSELFSRTQDASRVIGLDYMYLGKAYLNTGNEALAEENITKGVELDTTKVEELAAVAKKYYDSKKYEQAAALFKKVINLNSANPQMAMNVFFFAASNYWHYVFADSEHKNPDRSFLVEAEAGFSKLIELAPESESGYIYKARSIKYLDAKDNGEEQKGLAVPYYLDFVKLVTETKPDKAAANGRFLIEAYNYLGASAANTDKEKAKEYFNKTLAIDPNNAYATESIKILFPAPSPAKKAPIK